MEVRGLQLVVMKQDMEVRILDSRGQELDMEVRGLQLVVMKQDMEVRILDSRGQ